MALCTYTSHRINYRANIWGFRELGVKRIVSIELPADKQQNETRYNRGADQIIRSY